MYRKFGNTDFDVSILGYGAGHIGRDDLDEDFVGSLLNQIVDLGITLIDTAKGYGLSEQRIGRHLSYRRKDFILSTKVGYGVEGYQDWTYDCVAKGIHEALWNLQTDYIDIVHLHSCNKHILEHNGVIEALIKAKEEGKVRAIAYSGENEDLLYAIECGKFDSVQCSVNLFDQKSLNEYLEKAKNKNMGIIAKRPLANVPWLYDERPYGKYCEEYWTRMKKMKTKFTHNLDISKDTSTSLTSTGSAHSNNRNNNYSEKALRFAAYNDMVTSCIAGSLNIENIKQNLSSIKKGKLENNILKNIQKSFIENDDNWNGEI